MLWWLGTTSFFLLGVCVNIFLLYGLWEVCPGFSICLGLSLSQGEISLLMCCCSAWFASC